MFKLFPAALVLLSTSSAAIAKTNASNSTCLDAAHADRVAQNFRSLIHTYSDSDAAAFLTPNFTDYSDSVNELINSGCPNGSQPLGLPTFTSLQAFQEGQGAQPAIPFSVLNVWHGCTAVTLRWRSSKPFSINPNTTDATKRKREQQLQQQEVTGIAVLETVFNQGYLSSNHSQEPYFIRTVFSEFNSGAWLVDIGTFVPSCNADGTPIVSSNDSTAGNITSSAKILRRRRVRTTI